MKASKVAAVLFVLLAVETWGVVGAGMTRGVRYTCTLEVGPLCFLWEQSMIGKLLGDEHIEEVEDALQDAQKTWRDDLLDRLQAKKSGGLKKALEDAKDMAKDGLENAKRVFEETVK